MLRLSIAYLVFMCFACDYDYDDPEDPGDPGDGVDFIRFNTPGVWKEFFVDLTFQSGVFAADVIGGQQPRVWMLGPGRDMMPGMDDDFVPYPNVANPRKRTPHDGEWDRRLWVQFAGGAWNSLGIQVQDDRARLRASSSPPSFFPMTIYLWCPGDGTWALPCRTWLDAVATREARCFKYTANGFEKSVAPNTCVLYHPRIHWRITSCDDCPIPASAPRRGLVQPEVGVHTYPMRQDDGFTLSSLMEPEEPTLIDSIDKQMRRITRSAPGGVRVQPRREGDPAWLIRVGDVDMSVLCDAMTLLDTLESLPTGIPVGSFDEAPPGSLWAVLRRAADEEFDLAERRGYPYPPDLAMP